MRLIGGYDGRLKIKAVKKGKEKMSFALKLLLASMVLSVLMTGPVRAEDKLPTPAEISKIVDSELDKDLKLWYPRSIDPRGGYHSIFDQDWTLKPYETKGIVQQARMVWTASEVALRRPEKRAEFEKYAAHGYKFLRDKMYDKKFGGFFWEVKADGTPLSMDLSEMKHLYGESFALYGLANYYRLSKDPEALQLAQDLFYWIDKKAHDAKHGGYIEALYRDGRTMTAPPADRPDVVKGKTRELLGTKSMNTHLHLMESFLELYRVWQDPVLKERLTELLVIMRDVVPTWPGAMRQFFNDDWTPAATYVSFGHDIENTYLMEEAESVLGNPSLEKTRKVGKALLDHALQFGWDNNFGGFFYDGATFGAEPADSSKFWWVQAEGLNTLLLIHQLYGKDNPEYYRCFVKQWEFISKHILDAKYGGWFPLTDRDGGNPRGLDNRFSQVTHGLEKAHLWKTAYHEVRALLNVSDRLHEIIGGNKDNK